MVGKTFCKEQRREILFRPTMLFAFLLRAIGDMGRGDFRRPHGSRAEPSRRSALTSRTVIRTIHLVTPRRLLPVAFGSLAAFAAAMWFYGSGPDGRTDITEANRPDLLNDPEFAAQVELDVRKGRLLSAHAEVDAERLARLPRDAKDGEAAAQSQPAGWSTWIATAEGLADDLERTATRVRSNVSRHPMHQASAGWHELQSGRPEAALRRFRRILAHRPENPSALAGSAAALVALRRYQEAADMYARLLEITPEDAEARYDLGVVLGRLGRFLEAAGQFREAVRIDPNHARAHHNLAGLAQRDGRLAEARRSWEAYTRLRPEAASGWFNLGLVLMEYGDAQDAARCFSIVVTIQPDAADAYANLGLAYRSANDLDAALEAMQTANELSPCNAAMLRPLADLHHTIAEWHPPDEAAHLAEAARLEELIESLEVEAQSTGERVAGTEADADR